MRRLFRVKRIESLRPEPMLYEVSDSKVLGLIARDFGVRPDCILHNSRKG